MQRRDYKMEYSVFLQSARNFLPEGTANTLASVLEKTRATMEDFYSQVSVAANSLEYTQSGLSRRRIELGKQAKAQLDKLILPLLEGLDGNIASKQGAMKSMPAAEDRLIAALRAQEIRAGIRGADPLELQTRYLGAAEAGEAEFCSAIETSPFPLLPGPVIEQGRSMLMRSYNSALADEVDQLVYLREVYDSTLKTAQKDLDLDCELSGPDPVLEAATSN